MAYQQWASAKWNAGPAAVHVHLETVAGRAYLEIIAFRHSGLA